MINPTIEYHEEKTDLALVETEIIRRESEIAQKKGGADWLPQWYLGKLAEYDGLRDAVQRQAQVILSQINAQEEHLRRAWGAEFRRQVDADLAVGDGRKSKYYITGTAGYRKHPARLVVVDKRAALAWALDNTPIACEPVLARTTPLKEHVESGGDVPPGCEYTPARDVFFPAVEVKQIAGGMPALPKEEE